jgi:hypothetical protein
VSLLKNELFYILDYSLDTYIIKSSKNKMQTRSMIRNQTATKENDGCDVNHDQTQFETIRLPPTKLNYDALNKSNQAVISWILLGMGEQHAFQEMYDLLDKVESDARKLKQEKKIYLKNMIQAVRKPVQYLPDTMKIVKFHPEAAKAIKALSLIHI